MQSAKSSTITFGATKILPTGEPFYTKRVMHNVRHPPSHNLISLEALRRAIEAYLAHRPELNCELSQAESDATASKTLSSEWRAKSLRKREEIEAGSAHFRMQDLRRWHFVIAAKLENQLRAADRFV